MEPTKQRLVPPIVLDEFPFPGWKGGNVVGECDVAVVAEWAANTKMKLIVDACFWQS